MIVIFNIFSKLEVLKVLVELLSKKLCFRASFDSQHVKGSQALVESAWQDFYHIFLSLWGELIRKISPLLMWEILGVFANTLTADDKYTVGDCENVNLPIQMQLS